MFVFVSFLLAATFAQSGLECTLCEEAAGILKNKTDIIQTDLLKVCAKLNETSHQLECRLAVKTLIELLNSQTPQELCEKVKLCKSTEVSEDQLLGELTMMTLPLPLLVPQIAKPDFDGCSICKEVVGVVQGHTQQIITYLDSLCAKLNNTIEKDACDALVQELVNVFNSQTAEQICTEIKFCSSEKKFISNGKACGSCQNLFKIFRNNPYVVHDYDCTAHGSMYSWHMCQIMKSKAKLYLQDYAPDSACVDLGMCPKGWISGVY